MNSGLTIDFKWLGWPTGDALDRAMSADIGLAVGDDWLTLLEDQEASTVRTHLRGSAYHLAAWFAANWWRLRWEPRVARWTQNTDWRIAHGLASAGGGYVWPNVFFAGDGETFEVASFPQVKPPPFEPIRYLNRVDAHVSAADFESKVDAFLAGVLSRLDSLGVADARLPELWAEVLAERQDTASCQYRKLEAMAGFDPDEAPDVLLSRLLQDAKLLGGSALEEIAAEGRHDVREVLKTIRGLSRSKTGPASGGFRGLLPELQSPCPPAEESGPPWMTAARLARAARKQWGLGSTKPVYNKALGDLVSAQATIFKSGSAGEAPMPLALQTKTDGAFDIYFRGSYPTTRRFTLSRLIGDHLHFSPQEKLLPATEAKTARQKFQRAFAQEFLCPIDALLEKMQTAQPGQDDIEEAASHFHVSPLMVRTTMVNHHALGREALAWSD